MARLSTHVLDTASGKPAAGVRIRLYTCELHFCEARKLVKTVTTNSDGRAQVAGDGLEAGLYELVFSVGDYFGLQEDSPPFLDEVVVRFSVTGAVANYHVPLLVSPYGYTTYKGS